MRIFHANRSNFLFKISLLSFDRWDSFTFFLRIPPDNATVHLLHFIARFPKCSFLSADRLFRISIMHFLLFLLLSSFFHFFWPLNLSRLSIDTFLRRLYAETLFPAPFWSDHKICSLLSKFGVTEISQKNDCQFYENHTIWKN